MCVWCSEQLMLKYMYTNMVWFNQRFSHCYSTCKRIHLRPCKIRRPSPLEQLQRERKRKHMKQLCLESLQAKPICRRKLTCLRQSVVDEHEQGFTRRQMQSSTQDVDELAYWHISWNQKPNIEKTTQIIYSLEQIDTIHTKLITRKHRLYHILNLSKHWSRDATKTKSNKSWVR